ncbi:MAG TPA: hypothetical protein VJ837_05855 [Candidatus Paceibacterota bacterium]|nr:hypothetical protein [Candidatus Paceibacterota bacterium]
MRIEDAYSPIFWMDVEMRANSTLEKLDDFLRREWLECCGHLSDFDIDGINYSVTTSYEMGPLSVFADPTDRTMKVKLGEILRKGSRFQHTYDFGTSTELKLRVVDERQGRIGRESVRLLSQNEAPAGSVRFAVKTQVGSAPSACTNVRTPSIASFTQKTTTVTSRRCCFP